MEEKNHIYPIFDRMMTRQDNRIERIGQKYDCYRTGA